MKKRVILNWLAFAFCILIGASLGYKLLITGGVLNFILFIILCLVIGRIMTIIK